jgi:sterol desaturase/sphingolipid hydroxylase (fatty acid hydroxylase superfamily)
VRTTRSLPPAAPFFPPPHSPPIPPSRSVVPLFILPFHIYTVYALNILLVGWATMLHSSCPWEGNWLFIGARDHNVHHARGKLNSNFAAIFKIWDRIFGTLDLEYLPKWLLEERLQGGDDEKAAAVAPKKGKGVVAPAKEAAGSAKKATPAKAARSQSPAARGRAQRR